MMQRAAIFCLCAALGACSGGGGNDDRRDASPDGGGADSGAADGGQDGGGSDADAGADLCADVDCSANEGPCVSSTCDPLTGECQQSDVSDGTGCDDGNSCTNGDQCMTGVCVPGENQCNCDELSDCAEFEDDNLCNGTLICSDAKKCEIDSASVVSCPDATDAACQTSCDPADGQCKLADASCDDGDACTHTDTCSAGVCEGTSYVCEGDTDGLACTGSPMCDGEGGCDEEVQEGCLIDSTCVAEDGVDPENACRSCQPTTSTTEWISGAPEGVTDQRIAIVAVSVTGGFIRLRNISDETLDEDGWFVCFGSDNPYPPLGDFTLEPGEELTMFFGQSGNTDAEHHTNTNLPEADELGIYNSRRFSVASAMEAYLRYSRDGDDGGTTSRENVAETAGLWTKGDVIAIDAGDDGFYASGATDSADGFTATSTDVCL